MASENLSKPDISAAIAAAKSKRSERTQFDPAWVLRLLAGGSAGRRVALPAR